MKGIQKKAKRTDTVIEWRAWFDENDRQFSDDYILLCAIRKQAYDSKEEVVEDGGEPVERIVRVIVEYEDIVP